MSVSIPLWCDCDFADKSRRLGWQKFQSHYGAIATRANLRHGIVGNYVSIPLWCDCDLAQALQTADISRFQSHYGAIATRIACKDRADGGKFQSHYGAIATMHDSTAKALRKLKVSIPLWCDCDFDVTAQPQEGQLSFNPTMVRLRPFRAGRLEETTKRFNPTMVRLRLPLLAE